MKNISKMSALLLALVLLACSAGAALAEYNIGTLTEEQYQEIVELVKAQQEASKACECLDADGNRICAEDCACECHVLVCECLDAEGNRVCAEDCACECHIEEPLSEEILAWIESDNPTEEMIERAKKASSLDSLMLEGSNLVYVRTGTVIATYNVETGELTDSKLGVVVGVIDTQTYALIPAAQPETDSELE